MKLKKISMLLITLALMFVLSACGEQVSELKDNAYLTEEEVQEMIDAEIQEYNLEMMNLLIEHYVMYDRENEAMISMCYVEQSTKQCDFVYDVNALDDLIYNLEDWASYIEDEIEALSDDETTTEVELTLMTIAMLDILIYQTEAQGLETLTEEEAFTYQMMLIQRDLLLNEIE